MPLLIVGIVVLSVLAGVVGYLIGNSAIGHATLRLNVENGFATNQTVQLTVNTKLVATRVIPAGQTATFDVSVAFATTDGAVFEVEAASTEGQDAASVFVNSSRIFVVDLRIEPVAATKPALAWGPRTAITNGEDLSIGGMSPATAPANFRVNLRINTTFGTAVAFPTTSGTPVSITVSGYTGTFAIIWQDADGGNTLSIGDHIRVTRTGGLPAPSALELILFWVADGSAFPSATWTTP